MNEVNKFSVKMVVSMIIATPSLHVVGHLPINESGSQGPLLILVIDIDHSHSSNKI